MKKIVRLTESDLTRLVNRIIQEQEQEYPGYNPDWDEYKQGENEDLPTRLKRMNKSYDDNDYQFYKLRKMWASSIMNTKTEEALMDKILDIAELAKYRKTKPFN
jgi:hypothetical protein